MHVLLAPLDNVTFVALRYAFGFMERILLEGCFGCDGRYALFFSRHNRPTTRIDYRATMHYTVS